MANFTKPSRAVQRWVLLCLVFSWGVVFSLPIPILTGMTEVCSSSGTQWVQADDGPDTGPTHTTVCWLCLPAALPNLLTTCRYNIGLALIGAYLVEGGNVANRGLGAIGKRAAALNDADNLWATVFTMVLLGTIGLIALTVVQRFALRWHVSQRRPNRVGGSATTVRSDG